MTCLGILNKTNELLHLHLHLIRYGKCSRLTLIVCKNLENVLNATCAQDVCHVLRTHQKHDNFIGPRFLVRAASLDMHPLDSLDRIEFLKNMGGIGYCNITKCCTNVCPEHIQITDNAIIPMKERVADKFFDPIKWLWRKITGKG